MATSPPLRDRTETLGEVGTLEDYISAITETECLRIETPNGSVFVREDPNSPLPFVMLHVGRSGGRWIHDNDRERVRMLADLALEYGGEVELGAVSEMWPDRLRTPSGEPNEVVDNEQR